MYGFQIYKCPRKNIKVYEAVFNNNRDIKERKSTCAKVSIKSLFFLTLNTSLHVLSVLFFKGTFVILTI